MSGKNGISLAIAVALGTALLVSAASASTQSRTGRHSGSVIHNMRSGSVRSICSDSGGPSCSDACPLSGPPCRGPDGA
jgi:hypothetical protein